jgi:hypothetical protein
MDHNFIIQKLLAVSRTEWDDIIRICYNHMKLKLGNKVLNGAHSESRLGLNPYDYYFGEAVTALYKGRWEWKYHSFTLKDQIIRVIDSMISEQVRKYKIEKKNIKVSSLPQEQLAMFDGAVIDPDTEDLNNKCCHALDTACANNEKFIEFIKLKKNGVSYDDITTKMNCSKEEAYQMLETISRRANKILRTL